MCESGSVDARFLSLLWRFIKAGHIDKGLFRAASEGVPQGGVISPLLSNIMLNEFDQWLEAKHLSSKARKDRWYWNDSIKRQRPIALREHRQWLPAVAYCRYADDFVVIVKGNKAHAEAIREECRAFLEGRLKLTMNMDKTHITHVNDGFTFLGHRIIRKRGPRGTMRPVTTIPMDKFRNFAHKLVQELSGNYMATTVKGRFFYLYLIMDVYSRKIVGWEVFETESADLASVVFRKTHLREGLCAQSLVLHSDNGSPMKGATMLSTLQRLGVMASFSRPSVSDDNPYSEALFKTLKYHPGYPDKPFESLQQAREWVVGFQHWYNEVHRHSGLKFVTPAQRHRGEDDLILEQRHALYEATKAERPERWSGPTRNWEIEQIVFLNPGKPMKKEVDIKQKAA